MSDTRDVAGSDSPIARAAELLGSDPRFSAWQVTRPHPLLVMVREDARIVVVSTADVWDKGRDLLRPYAQRTAEGDAALILVGRPADPDLAQAASRGLAAIVSDEVSAPELLVALRTSFELMEARARAESRGKWLNRYRYELGELIEISRALTTEREIDKLLGLILEKSRFITAADAGSIYVVEGDDPDPARRMLRFKLTQNDSVKFDSREFIVPISARSISGSAALSRRIINIGDVYDLPPTSEFSFDHRFDDKIGYRTRSMLTAPLIDKQGDVIGVLQLINKKRDPKGRLVTDEDYENNVIPFDERSEELLATLASHAGIALENALLYAEIKHLFEGFVTASVSAIEQRDPTTSGHSRRVADLTVGLARALERESTGPYREVSWSSGDLREIEFASLLHDFGKIGVREQVLVKAKKLYPAEFDTIRARIDFTIRTVEAEILARKLRALQKGASGADMAELDAEGKRRTDELEASWDAIVAANEPTILKGGDFARIEALARESYTDLRGRISPLLTSTELSSLSVTKGSLTNGEIDEIRSHVTHTYNFLHTIPWGSDFRRVPLIAGAHHERLNGTGYPNHLRAEEIPLQSKMMSVSDIFDALTASDRPYKRAVPLEKALDILGFEVKDQHIDGELLRIFREARVWEGVLKSPLRVGLGQRGGLRVHAEPPRDGAGDHHEGQADHRVRQAVHRVTQQADQRHRRHVAERVTDEDRQRHRQCARPARHRREQHGVQRRERRPDGDLRERDRREERHRGGRHHAHGAARHRDDRRPRVDPHRCAARVAVLDAVVEEPAEERAHEAGHDDHHAEVEVRRGELHMELPDEVVRRPGREPADHRRLRGEAEHRPHVHARRQKGLDGRAQRRRFVR